MLKHEYNIEIGKVIVNNYKTKGLGINNPTQDSFFLSTIFSYYHFNKKQYRTEHIMYIN